MVRKNIRLAQKLTFKNIYIIISVIFIFSKGFSQDLFHDPATSWNTIKSEHFSVHIPKKYIDLGIKITNICENIYPSVSHSLDYYPGRTHVVVHTEIDEFGGFSSVFPWRMELFIMPPQSNIIGKNTDWLENLILHEFTHIVHMRKHKGISSLTKPFFGDYNSIWQMITPVWFTEGFPTLNETRFGQGGRGRNPHFWMQMAESIKIDESWRLNNTNYNSRKRTPTSLMPYISGYYLTDRINQNFGEYTWGKILNRYSSYPILGFKNAIQSVTGQNINNIYDEMINDFIIQRNDSSKHSDYTIWYNPNLLEGHYSPRWLDDDNIIFYQKGIENTQEIVQVNRNQEYKILFNRKISKIENCFTIGDNKIYTSEKHTDPKYSATAYSDLHAYSLDGKQHNRLTIDKRLYSIDISPDKTKILAVQTDVPNNCLAIIDSKNGHILQNIKFKSLSVLNPRWSPSGGKFVVALQDSNGVVNIAVFDINSNDWEYIYNQNSNQDNHPCWSKDEKYIFFSSDQSGIFNIWAADVNTGNRWMVTDVEFGAFTPDVSPSGNELAFAVYSENGYRIATQTLNNTNWIKSDKIINTNKLLYQKDKLIFNELEQKEKHVFSIKNYSPLSQILKPQGWIPYLYNEEDSGGIAVHIRSEDALHRHKWFGKVGLSLQHLSPTYDMTYVYSKYWPKFNFRTYDVPRKIANNDETDWWREIGYSVGVSTPLILENNIFRTSSIFSMQFVQNRLKHSKGVFTPDSRIYRGVKLDFGLNRSSYIPKKITPHFAWFLNTQIEISNSSLLSDYTSKRFSSELDMFLPLNSKSNLELYFGYLFRKGDYGYSNNFVPIGFSENENIYQLRWTNAYYLPVVYCEWQTPIIPIFIEYLYIKPFIDYAIGWNEDKNKYNNSITNSIGLQIALKNIAFYRYDFELGINIYKRSDRNDLNYSPFIRFNI